MRIFVATIALLFSSFGFGQGVEVLSLYEKDALLTGRLLPFKVVGASGLEVVEVSAKNGCHVMKDRHRKNIFHLYCEEETVTGADLVVSQGSDLKSLSINGIYVAKLSLVKPPGIGPGPVIPTESLGKKLFRQDCAQCHPGSKVISKGQTAATIRAALSRGQMKSKGLDALYNSDNEKIDALVEYINNEK